jgi:hypothetical protein
LCPVARAHREHYDFGWKLDHQEYVRQLGNRRQGRRRRYHSQERRGPAVTCTFGTGTSCNDTTHSFTVVAGDVLRIQSTSGASDAAANIAAAFELWN